MTDLTGWFKITCACIALNVVSDIVMASMLWISGTHPANLIVTVLAAVTWAIALFLFAFSLGRMRGRYLGFHDALDMLSEPELGVIIAGLKERVEKARTARRKT